MVYQELEALVSEAHRTGSKIRPIGSGISPNGLALCEDGMVNLALMDRVLSVDTETGRVTVQAGARVEQVRPKVHCSLEKSTVPCHWMG